MSEGGRGGVCSSPLLIELEFLWALLANNQGFVWGNGYKHLMGTSNFDYQSLIYFPLNYTTFHSCSGPFNNYVDKIREGGKKCKFLSTLRV